MKKKFFLAALLTLAASMAVSGCQKAAKNDAEESVKTGTLGDVLSVELLIVKYSSARAARA